MGKHAFNARAYARAVEWFEESYILAGLENNQTIRQDQVMEFIQHAINMVKKNSTSPGSLALFLYTNCYYFGFDNSTTRRCNKHKNGSRWPYCLTPIRSVGR